MFERYAIFYTPPAGSFAAFGAAWLGWDSAEGSSVVPPDALGINIEALTKTPRRYGFHATLKAPFRLAPDKDLGMLTLAVDEFAAAHMPVPLDGLILSHDHGFLALRPVGDVTALCGLADDIVRIFNPFGASLTDAEITRRREAKLTPRQDRQMLDWGYPYIFEDFHFHMTLSGAVDAAQATQVMPVLDTIAKPAIPNPMIIDAITIMGQDTAGMFHQIHRATLTG